MYPGSPTGSGVRRHSPSRRWSGGPHYINSKEDRDKLCARGYCIKTMLPNAGKNTVETSTMYQANKYHIPLHSMWSERQSLASPQRRSKTAAIRRKFKEEQSARPGSCIITQSAGAGAGAPLQHRHVGAVGATTGWTTPEQDDYTEHIERRQQERLQAFVDRPGINPRPTFVFNITLPPPKAPKSGRDNTMKSSLFQSNVVKQQKHYLVNPEWDSERHIMNRLVQQGQQDSLKYGWM